MHNAYLLSNIVIILARGGSRPGVWGQSNRGTPKRYSLV